MLQHIYALNILPQTQNEVYIKKKQSKFHSWFLKDSCLKQQEQETTMYIAGMSHSKEIKNFI